MHLFSFLFSSSKLFLSLFLSFSLLFLSSSFHSSNLSTHPSIFVVYIHPSTHTSFSHLSIPPGPLLIIYTWCVCKDHIVVVAWYKSHNMIQSLNGAKADKTSMVQRSPCSCCDMALIWQNILRSRRNWSNSVFEFS